MSKRASLNWSEISKQRSRVMLKNFQAKAIPIVLVLVTPLQAVAQQAQPNAPDPQQYYWPGPWHMWGFWSFGPMMIFFALFCIAMMYFMMGGMHHRTARDSHALELLNERFARGEI